MRVFCPITRIIRQDRGAKMTHDFMMTTRASGKILNAIKIKTNQGVVHKLRLQPWGDGGHQMSTLLSKYGKFY